MFPEEFDYYRPETLSEATGLLARFGGDAKILAGGHSLLPAMRLRLAQPRVLVDIGRLKDLAYVREENGQIAIGALTTHYEIETSPVLDARATAFPDAARVLADVQVRNRGTVGGALAHADPAADYPAVVLALGGEVVFTGPGGRRSVAVDDFFLGPFTTAILPGEILTEIRTPAQGPHSASAYVKFVRRASDYGLAGVAARLALAEDGTCREARVAITCVGPMAYRATATEQALVGQRLTEEAIDRAAAQAAAGVEVTEDPYVPADYRAHLARVIARRAITLARDRALGARA